jgi:hypothetical protein
VCSLVASKNARYSCQNQFNENHLEEPAFNPDDDIPFGGEDYDVPSFLRRPMDINAPTTPHSPPSSSTFWSLLRMDSVGIGEIIKAMPEKVRNELWVFADKSGLVPEEVIIIFLMRLFDHLDPVLFSRQLARRTREQYANLRVPYELDRDRLEQSVSDSLKYLMSQMSVA